MLNFVIKSTSKNNLITSARNAKNQNLCQNIIILNINHSIRLHHTNTVL